MEIYMNDSEKSFKTLMLKIGAVLLVFWGLFNVLGTVYIIFDEIVRELLADPAASIVSEVFYAFIYAAAFAIPAGILAYVTRTDGVPLIKKAALPAKTPIYIIGAIECIISFAYINSMIVSIFDYADFSQDVMWKAEYDELYEVLLQLLTVAVIPGIFEEVLFRGVVLAKLRPYGKGPAIIISAVLFGLMHQNAGQFLYAMAAGLVLGFVAYETGSLLCCILIHFSNNAFSVLEQAAYANLPENIYAVISYTVELLIFVCGIISFVYVVYSYYSKKKENDFSEGIYQKELVLSETAVQSLPAAKLVRSFFSPTVIAFAVISISSAAMLIFESLVYSQLV